MKRKLQWIVALALLGSLTFEYEQGFQLTAAMAQNSGSIEIGWTPPTEYTDNAPLLEQDLDYDTLFCNAAELKQIDSVAGTRNDTVDLTGLAIGDYACHLTVTTLLASESGPSNIINFTIGPRVPMAPAGLSWT